MNKLIMVILVCFVAYVQAKVCLDPFCPQGFTPSNKICVGLPCPDRGGQPVVDPKDPYKCFDGSDINCPIWSTLSSDKGLPICIVPILDGGRCFEITDNDANAINKSIQDAGWFSNLIWHLDQQNFFRNDNPNIKYFCEKVIRDVKMQRSFKEGYGKIGADPKWYSFFQQYCSSQYDVLLKTFGLK